MEFLKTVDTWFLVITVALLGAFFVWSVQNIFSGVKESIKDLGATFERSLEKLERLITDLYDHKSNHESRIVAIETKCAWEHEYQTPRSSAGRRFYDPSTIPKSNEIDVENFNTKGD